MIGKFRHLCGGNMSNAATVSREQIEKLIKQLNDIENARPLLAVDAVVEGLSRLMSADTEVWANGRHIVGRSGADELDRALFELVDDYHRDIEHMVIDPPFASFTWRMRSAKRNFEALGCSMMKINEVGLISCAWMFFDPAPFKALGMQV
jgi:hypothetical protein